MPSLESNGQRQAALKGYILDESLTFARQEMRSFCSWAGTASIALSFQVLSIRWCKADAAGARMKIAAGE